MHRRLVVGKGNLDLFHIETNVWYLDLQRHVSECLFCDRILRRNGHDSRWFRCCIRTRYLVLSVFVVCWCVFVFSHQSPVTKSDWTSEYE